MGGVTRLLGQPYSVGVQLEEGKALFFSQGDDGIQVITHGGLATGELDIEGPAPGKQKIVLFPNFFQGQVPGSLLPGAGEAHRAAQIAPVGQFQQHAAAVPLVALAQAAVVGASPFHGSCPHGNHGSGDIGDPPGQIAFQVSLPDQGAEGAVVPAPFFKVDITVRSYRLPGGNPGQAHGADTGGFSDFHATGVLAFPGFPYIFRRSGR